jgi:hypothetical protein
LSVLLWPAEIAVGEAVKLMIAGVVPVPVFPVAPAVSVAPVVPLAQEGAQLYEKGDFQGALDKFKQAHQQFPSPKLFFNLAQAFRGLSRNPEALEAYERFLAEAKDASPEYREQAVAQVAELGAKLARVAVACNQPGAVVTIDRSERGTIPLQKPVAVEPGAHQLALAWRGESKSVEFTAVAGQVLSLVLTFEEKKLPPEPVVAAPKPEAQVLLPAETKQVPSATPSSHRHTWYWIAGGVVVTAAATALILVYTTRDHYPTADLGTRAIGGRQ